MAKKRRIEVTTIQVHNRSDGGKSYSVSVPSWIAEKVLQVRKSRRVKWDFEGGTALVRREDAD